MFEGATAFNQPIGNWPLSASNIQMNRMFASATSFNQTIGNLNTTNVTNMSIMFYNAQAFNQDISTKTINAGQPNEYVAWDMSNVTNIGEMFRDAYSFNQDISNWDTSNVTSMLGTFQRATAFNRDIGNWNVGKVTNFSNFMESKTTYSFLHTIYDGWINNKLQPQRTITFNTIKYSGSAAEGRALLSRTYNTASITGYSNDGGNMAITCSVNHNVIVGNKIFMSGSSFAGINGVQTVAVVGSPTTLTLNTIYDPTATGGTAITGYGWSITDGGVV
jgi:surface protein